MAATREAVVKGDRDPGYGSTSKMISEAALTLNETESGGGRVYAGRVDGGGIADAARSECGVEFHRRSLASHPLPSRERQLAPQRERVRGSK